MSEEIKITKEEIADTEIPVEDATPQAVETDATKPDVAEELRQVGQQLADAFRSMWNSEERQKLEAEMREGMQNLASEVDKVMREIREGTAGQKLREEASELRTQVESGEFGRKARTVALDGLRWLSEELGRLADQFTPTQKETPAPEPPTEIPVDDKPAE